MGFFSRRTDRSLVNDLADDYRAEVEQAALLRRHAERAPYPQAAATLRQLAEVEDRHATLLRDRIAALGGVVPTVLSEDAPGMNQWERAVTALERARRKRQHVLEQITHWDPDEPGVIELLHQIEQEDHQQFVTYEHLIMRADPQSIN